MIVGDSDRDKSRRFPYGRGEGKNKTEKVRFKENLRDMEKQKCKY